MGTRNVTVSTAAQLVPGSNPGGFGDDVTVLNTGSATAYLTDQAPDSTTDGQPLSAGSSLTWTKGQPLWVIGPSSTTLVVSENTGPIFDAGAIAAQILAQGLAGQIATAINVIGVPAIESATVLEDFSAVTPAGFSPGLAGPAIDCSRYQSLRIYCSETYGIGGTYPPPRAYSITWYADSGGTIPVGEDAFNVPTGTNGIVPAASAVVSVPCRGPFFTIDSLSISVGPSTSGCVVLGSYRPAQDLKWSKIADGFAGSSGVVILSPSATGDQGGTFSIPATSPSEPPSTTRSSRAAIACRCSPSAPQPAPSPMRSGTSTATASSTAAHSPRAARRRSSIASSCPTPRSPSRRTSRAPS
jgi:hypothetical protein